MLQLIHNRLGIKMKKILTDCDGVLLDWELAFHEWMRSKGYSKVNEGVYGVKLAYELDDEIDHHDIVREFNTSAWMGWLEVYRDAFKGVQDLWLAGYKFDVITSMSRDPYAIKLREMNLHDKFGPYFMDRFVSLDTAEDKDEALSEYKDTGLWWVEDKPENCDAGLRAGLRPILIDHLHNRWYDNPEVIRVSGWSEIASLVLEDQVNEVA
mgnify:CR=1 FL=1